MKTKTEISTLWTCPKCNRQFERMNQSHSCKIFPLEKHFEGKEKGEKLYKKFKQVLKKNLGPFKVDSVECCIHFVAHSTFVAVKVLRNKIRIDFTLPAKIKSHRLHHSIQMSKHRFLYYADIINEDEIDDELIGWLNEAYKERAEIEMTV